VTLRCTSCNHENASGTRTCRVCNTPLVSPFAQLDHGSKLLNGAYTLWKVLVRGGFGITCLGSDAFRSPGCYQRGLPGQFGTASKQHPANQYPGAT